MYVPTFTRRVKERLFSMFYIKHRTEDIEVLLYRSIPDEGRQLKRHGAEAVARQRARPTCSRMPASQLARRLVCWRWAGWRLPGLLWVRVHGTGSRWSDTAYRYLFYRSWAERGQGIHKVRRHVWEQFAVWGGHLCAGQGGGVPVGVGSGAITFLSRAPRLLQAHTGAGSAAPRRPDARRVPAFQRRPSAPSASASPQAPSRQPKKRQVHTSLPACVLPCP